MDHVFPRVPVRQWVLSLPKRLRPYLHYDPTLAGAVLRIFLTEIARTGAVSFIHRFGAALNPHIHLMCMDAQMPRAHGQMTASCVIYISHLHVGHAQERPIVA